MDGLSLRANTSNLEDYYITSLDGLKGSLFTCIVSVDNPSSILMTRVKGLTRSADFPPVMNQLNPRS